MSSRLTLTDGSRIAIIGGGPAGSFFAHFIQKYAGEKGITLDVTIFDGKDFLQCGPKGCNLCAGVIAESLNQRLKREGIFLPEKRIINRVEGYCFHAASDNIFLSCAENSKNAIATVYRGNGPRDSNFADTISFDDFLLNRARDKGIKVVPEPVRKIELASSNTQQALVYFGKNESLKKFEADLIVGAFGVNSHLAKKVESLDFGYKQPSTLRVFQAELQLGHERVFSTFGNIIHIFIPKTRSIRFAMVVPKGDYATVTLIGKEDARTDILSEFFKSNEIKKKLVPTVPLCSCFPKIAVSPAKKPFADRFVIIGDASYSRHYKNGIESAYHTARLAARTAVFHGIDVPSFKAHYYKPARKLIIRDNYYGRFLFALNDFISSDPHLSQAHLSLAKIKDKRNASKRIRSILWNMFTGNIPYKKIFLNALDIKLHLFLFINTMRYAVEQFKTLIEQFDRKISDVHHTRSDKK